MAIATHNCKNDQQDQLHGVGRRVVNPMAKSKQNGVFQRYRCTVCKGEVDKSAVVSGSGK
jgi:hypothetical protein